MRTRIAISIPCTYTYSSMHCTLYNTRTMYNVHSTVHNRIWYIVHCTGWFYKVNTYIVRRTIYIIHYTVYNLHCTLFIVQCIVYHVHYTVHNVQCTIYMYKLSGALRIVRCGFIKLFSLYSVQCSLNSVEYTL